MKYETRNPTAASALLDGEGGWAYLDVRTVEEFERGHSPGAYNIPVALRTPMGMAPNPEFLRVVRARFEVGQSLLVGCKMGGRSAHACELLADAGYRELVNVHGGFSGAPDEPGWEACGLPVEREVSQERSYEGLLGSASGESGSGAAG